MQREYSVEYLEDDCVVEKHDRTKRFFKVRWKGNWTPEEQSTWEPEEHIDEGLITEYLEKKAKTAAAGAEADPQSAEDAVNPGRPPIEFNDVPKGKHRIIKFPHGSDEWYFLECKEHQRHFNTPHATRAAGDHLRGPHRLSGKTENVVAVLGVRVLNCTEAAANRNNKLLRDARAKNAQSKVDGHGETPDNSEHHADDGSSSDESIPNGCEKR